MRMKQIHRRILGGCLACFLCFTGSIPAFSVETATPANADERTEILPDLESEASETLDGGTPETPEAPEAPEEVSLVFVTEIQNEGELLSLPDFTLPLRTTPSDDDLEEIYQLALQYQTVCATVSAGEEIRQETFPVSWDFSAIDQTTPGEYTAAGRIELPEGYAFGEAVLRELQISVRVEEMPPAVITSIEQWYPYTDAFAVQQGSETEALEALFAASPYYLECYAENEQKSLFYDMEMPLIYVLADMEKYGIKVDKAALLAYQKRLGESLDGMEEEIYALAGEKFNINSPKQLGVILFEKLGLKGGKKTKTGYSTAADVLEKLRTAHPIVERILHYRQLAKLKSTYADGLLAVMDAETEKIYSTFNQTITATGRISSTEPNLQNIPVRLELGRELRKIFIPESAEFCFLDADYSQIELRVLAHISGDESLIAAFKSNQDIHRMTASQVFHVPFDEVTPLQRSNAKAVNFGIIYGKGAFSLGQDLGISRKEAEEYINAYFARYPKIKTFMEDTIKNGTKNGYVSTLWNRRRNMPELQSSNFMQRAAGERAAMNMPIQGTAADIIKLAMIKVHRALQEGGYRSRLILQVHDELLIEAYKEEKDAVAKILKENMEHAADLLVPLDVDVHEGASWFEAK